MGNWKSRSDDEIAWANKSGNRGKTYPGDNIARKQYERDKAAGENNLSAVRNFLFGKSDARKRDVENAVNARRDAGTPMKLEPYKAQKPVALPRRINPRMVPYATKNGAIDLNQPDMPEDRPQYEDDDTSFDTIAQGQMAKKGGKISLKNCKVTTHAKNKKQSNW